MAEQKKTGAKQHNNVQAGRGTAAPKQTVKEAPETGNATGLRIGAAVLWLAAIGLEVLALLILNGNVTLSFIPLNSLAQIIVALVLDLIFVIIGSQLWKKANRIDPASEKNKLKFWLWNNMGVIVCAVAFIPFVILALTNKETDAKTKKIASIVAIVALLIGGIASYDFNPISAEQKAEAIAEYGAETVYWTPFGKVYHLYKDCHTMNRTDDKTQGTVEKAIEKNRTRVCSYCEKRRNEETMNNTGIE